MPPNAGALRRFHGDEFVGRGPGRGGGSLGRRTEHGEVGQFRRRIYLAAQSLIRASASRTLLGRTVDNDISAADPAVARPQWLAMLDALRCGEIDEVVAYDRSQRRRLGVGRRGPNPQGRAIRCSGARGGGFRK